MFYRIKTYIYNFCYINPLSRYPVAPASGFSAMIKLTVCVIAYDIQFFPFFFFYIHCMISTLKYHMLVSFKKKKDLLMSLNIA